MSAAPADGGATCRCGYGRGHHMVSPVPTYTNWGKFWVIFMGVSSVPIRLDFQCRVCGQTFDHTTDPDELRKLL